MDDHEMIGELIRLNRVLADAADKHQTWIVFLLATCSALIEAQPNKDVLRTTFSAAWKGLGGPELAAKLSREDRDAWRPFFGALAEVAFPND